jgi:two-component system sensor histidine kinase/response regulator
VPDHEGPIVDASVLEELAASVGGDRTFVLQLVETYRGESAAHLQAVEEAVAAGDATALVRAAHTLKSSSATLGAERVSAQARALERAGRSGTLDEEARTVVRSLRRDWEATMVALRAWTEGGTAR